MNVSLPTTSLSRSEVVNALLLFASLPDSVKSGCLLDHTVFVPIAQPELWNRPSKALVQNIVKFVLHQYGVHSLRDDNLKVPHRFWMARQDVDVWLRGVKL